jgi:hypothetical protein
VDRNSRDDGASEAAGDFGVTVVQFQINPRTALPIDVSSGRQLGGEIYRVIIAAIFFVFCRTGFVEFQTAQNKAIGGTALLRFVASMAVSKTHR